MTKRLIIILGIIVAMITLVSCSTQGNRVITLTEVIDPITALDTAGRERVLIIDIEDTFDRDKEHAAMLINDGKIVPLMDITTNKFVDKNDTIIVIHEFNSKYSYYILYGKYINKIDNKQYKSDAYLYTFHKAIKL